MSRSAGDPVRVHVNGAGTLPPGPLVQAVEATLREEGVSRGEVSITLLDDEAMAELNRRWLDREGTTDVISFSLAAQGEPPLGDVYVGVEQARRQADEHGIPLEEELIRLVVHGTLHVLGHDHPEGDDRAESPMFRRQEALVRSLTDPA